MIRRFSVFLLAALFLLSGAISIAQAAPPQQQNTAAITTFTTSAKSVDRASLVNRTARIPVSWATANRPNTANLVFEQVLPDNSTVNIELPRDNA